MKRWKFISVAALFACAALWTSCSGDVMIDEADNVLPQTKALPGAYTVKTIGVTVGVNYQWYNLFYDGDNRLDSVSIFRLGRTSQAWVDRTQPGKVIVYCDDPWQGEVMRFTYTLDSIGHVVAAEEVYDSDGWTMGKMQFAYDARGRLTAIRQGLQDNNGDWNYADEVTFTYRRGNNYAAMAVLGESVMLLYDNSYLNLASFDLNLWCMVGPSTTYGDILNYAILADLFPNAPNLVSRAMVDNNNKGDFVYNMSGNKALSCMVTTKAEHLAEDAGEPVVVTRTTSIVFGY